ncbi:MAG: dihydropteroate synthase [bacterium]
MLVYPIRLHNNEQALGLLKSIDVEPYALDILSPKSRQQNILLKSVKTSWANIIKQEMLSCGGDAAISRSSYACLEKFTDVLLMGSESVIQKFVSKMKSQPCCFSSIVEPLEKIIGKNTKILEIGNKTFDLSKDFILLGILNVTPDSFSDGGKFNDYDSAMKQAEFLLKNGADILDIGGESTKPSSVTVSAEQELERVMPIIEAVKKNFNSLISVDTYKPEVIKASLSAGANLINDVSGGQGVFSTATEIVAHGASAIVMMNLNKDGHVGSTTENKLNDPIGTFFDFCVSKTTELSEKGVLDKRLIFDPGIGFGLSDTDINTVLKNMYSFTASNIPVCVGISRKSYIGRKTGLEPGERDAVANAISLSLMGQGVRIFRTHDTKGLSDIVKFYKSIQGDLDSGV